MKLNEHVSLQMVYRQMTVAKFAGKGQLGPETGGERKGRSTGEQHKTPELM
jgi:hypothetical protein